MSTEDTTVGEGSEAMDAPTARKPVGVIGFVAGLIVGSVVGWAVAGPMLVQRAFPGGVPAAIAAEPPRASSSTDDALPLDSAGAPRSTHSIENLIINPAGTQGTRFLLVSMAIEALDGPTLKLLEQRDVEVRDAVIDLLGSSTVPELTEMENRENVKAAVRERVQRLLGRNTIGRIYFSQYVIQ
jgi:flagellar FliL protein